MLRFLRIWLGLLGVLAFAGPEAHAQLSGGTLYGSIPGPLSIGSSSRNLTVFGTLNLTISNKVGANAVLGVVNNTLAPNTNALPGGINGYGTIEVGSTGNSVFGATGQAELYASTGAGIGAEFTARNLSGNAPDTTLPPNLSIGTTTAALIGQNVTCGVAGTNDCSIGQYITNESGSYSDKAFNTGQYIGVYRQWGQYIAAQSSGNQTTATLQNNGTGINLVLGTTGTMSATNAVINVIDSGSASHFSVRQNGDVYGNTAILSGGGTPTASAGCGTGPTIAGGTNAGRVTIGTSPSTTCTLTFIDNSLAHTSYCTAGNESSGARTVFATGTSGGVTLTPTAGGSFTATDKLTYVCF